jgi:hypothetical protein
MTWPHSTRNRIVGHAGVGASFGMLWAVRVIESGVDTTNAADRAAACSLVEPSRSQAGSATLTSKARMDRGYIFETGS